MPTISALARRFRLSRSTLLYYDRIGLLRPAARSRKDYRQYGEAEAGRLDRICLYRRAGLPLAEIRCLLDAPEGAQEPVLERHLRDLDAQIGQLREQQRLVAGLLRNPGLLDGLQAMDKATWVGLLRASGFSDADMDRWHMTFESNDPARHQRFLELLGLTAEEVACLRAWAAKGRPPA